MDAGGVKTKHKLARGGSQRLNTVCRQFLASKMISQLHGVGGEGGKLQSLSVTFTLRTSLMDILGRPYMTSCKVFKSILTENTDLYLGQIIKDDALQHPLVFIVDLSVT